MSNDAALSAPHSSRRHSNDETVAAPAVTATAVDPTATTVPGAPATASASASSASASSSSFQVVRHVHCWTCDVCLVASFPTLDEATRHEEMCLRRRQQQERSDEDKLNIPTTDTATSVSPSSISSSDELARDSRDAINAESAQGGEESSGKQKRLEPAKGKATTAATTKKKSSVMEILMRPPKSKVKKKDASASSSSSAATARTTATGPKRGRGGGRSGGAGSTGGCTLIGSNRRTGSTAATTKPTKPSEKKGTNKESRGNDNHIDLQTDNDDGSSEEAARSLIQEQEKLLREQQVLNEFRAKRKAKEELWNRRNAKQQQQQLQSTQRQSKQQPTGSAAAKPSAPSSGPTRVPSSSSSAEGVAAVRFPNPSHVVGGSMTDPSVSSRRLAGRPADASPGLLAPQLLTKRDPPLPTASTADSTWPSSFAAAVLSPPNDSFMQDQSLLQQLFASTWDPPQRSESRGVSHAAVLWADAYSFRSVETLPEYGEEAWEAADAPEPPTLQGPRRQLEDFVRGWMVQRHESHRQRSERQERLQRKWSASGPSSGRHAKKKVKRRNDDDDGWLGATFDDEYDDGCAQGNALPAVCLLVGPVGAGKTSLVRSVVESSPEFQGCRVLEINTAHKRGSAALKKVVEEATQSYSSLELFQRKDSANQGVGRDFQGTCRDQQRSRGRRGEAFEDSEGDEGDFASSDEDDPSARVSGSDGSALTVIMVDEVDLLYEEDAGFWSVVSELSKRSKSPLVLTANAVPEGIAMCREYQLIHVERPNLQECSAWLKYVTTEQGLQCKVSDPRMLSQALYSIASTCDRDLRRLAHELQLFSHGNHQENVPVPDLSPPRAESCHIDSAASPSPVVTISRVEPERVRAESYPLLTIHGSGFTALTPPCGDCDAAEGWPVLVRVAGRACPIARIVSDNVILAVKAPCPPLSPEEQTPFNAFRKVYRAWNSELKEITVSSARPSGLTSATEGALLRFKTTSGSLGVRRANACLLECNFSTLSVKSGVSPDDVESDSEEEMELDVYQRTHGSSQLPALLPRPTESIDWTVVEGILQSGLSSWKKDNACIAPDSCSVSREKHCDAGSVERLADAAALASDGALIQEIGRHGLPWISGACRGFAGDLTTSSGLSNDKSNRYENHNEASALSLHSGRSSHTVCTSWPINRPSEDRLFASGWKDDCYFYGDANTYMTRPLSHELQWLRRTESSVRGAVPWNSDATNPEPEEVAGESNTEPAEDNDEDAFLPRAAPACILAWGASLMRLVAPASGRRIRMLDTFQLALSALERGQAQLDLLRVLFREFYQIQLFAGGLLSRTYDHSAKSLMPLEMVDCRLFLDYLPLLRVMATVDDEVRAASLNSLDAPASRKRRQTRNSAQRMENRHFLSDLVPVSQFDEDRDDSVPVLVKRLAKHALHRSTPVVLELQPTLKP